ncbi:MAG TPA: HutD family protein [Telluria sp.]
MTTRLIPYANLEASPWKNGGGSTTEIAVAPHAAGFDEFDWRISLARIVQDGPFSAFPGIDRTLALVEGDGVLLDFDGERRVLLSNDDPVISFDGGHVIDARLAGAATVDFNVMTRQGVCTHQFGMRQLDGASEFAPRGDVTLLFLAQGDFLDLANGEERIGMVRFDTVAFESGASWTLEAGRASVFVVDIYYDR